ncbi:hypothetical protein ABZ927_36765 [Streptomyces massasporeus]
MWSWLARPTALFGGVWALLVSSSAVAAPTRFGRTTRAARVDDALWVLFTALALALAFALAQLYARQIDRRDAQGIPVRGAVRAVLTEGNWTSVQDGRSTVQGAGTRCRPPDHD